MGLRLEEPLRKENAGKVLFYLIICAAKYKMLCIMWRVVQSSTAVQGLCGLQSGGGTGVRELGAAVIGLLRPESAAVLQDSGSCLLHCQMRER